MFKYITAAALLIAAGPAFAQAGAGQTPPSPNAQTAQPQTMNSLPAGAANMNTNSAANPNLAGQGIGGISTGTPATTSGGPGNASSATVPVPATR